MLGLREPQLRLQLRLLYATLSACVPLTRNMWHSWSETNGAVPVLKSKKYGIDRRRLENETWKGCCGNVGGNGWEEVTRGGEAGGLLRARITSLVRSCQAVDLEASLAEIWNSCGRPVEGRACRRRGAFCLEQLQASRVYWGTSMAGLAGATHRRGRGRSAARQLSKAHMTRLRY